MFTNIFTGTLAALTMNEEFVDQVISMTLLEFFESSNTGKTRAQIEQRIKDKLTVLDSCFPICDHSLNSKEIIDASKIVVHVDYRISPMHSNVLKEYVLHQYPWKSEATGDVEPLHKLEHSWVEQRPVSLIKNNNKNL